MAGKYAAGPRSGQRSPGDPAEKSLGWPQSPLAAQMSFLDHRSGHLPLPSDAMQPNVGPKAHRLQERSFHLVMGGVFLASCFLDEVMRRAEIAWNVPQLGFVSTIIGAVWLWRYFGWRNELLEERVRVLDDRCDRLLQRVDALDDEQRERRRPLV